VTGNVGRPATNHRDTRNEILAAARALFADLGFERTTMRTVATRAGVDVALIYYHFDSKGDLLAAALTVPESAIPVLQPIPAGTPHPGKAIAQAALKMWENDLAVRSQALAMFRTALSHEHAAQLLQNLHSTTVLAVVAEVVADDDRELRATLIGAQLTGLLVNRYLFKVNALATADLADLIDAAAPAIDHYLTGDLRGEHPS
jgi:AcrR family transcriptional regulator